MDETDIPHIKNIVSDKIELQPCRKCGSHDYELWTGAGTQASLECNTCGLGENIQVCDMFDHGDPRRHADFIDDNFTNRQDIVEIVNRQLFEQWNIRHQPRASRQNRVGDWIVKMFGPSSLADRKERISRLLEEVFELAQAEDYPREYVARILRHVYDKPKGNPEQEIGGVGVTLLAYAQAVGLDADQAEELEVQRIESKTIDHFRKRHQIKADAGIALQSEV